MIKDKLIQLGLTENEARLYEYLLDNYKAKASELAKHLDVTHPAVKKMIDSLLEKRLIKPQDFGKTRYYFLDEPKHLTRFVQREIERRKEESNRHIELVREIELLIGEKELIEKKDIKTAIKFLEGQDGINTLIHLISQAKSKDICEFYDTDLALYQAVKDKQEHKKILEEAQVKLDVVYTETDDDFKSIIAQDKVKLDKKKVYFPSANMIVFDNKVSFSFYSNEKYILLIENQWIANTLRTFFKNLKQALQKK